VATYYVTVNGAGDNSGDSWANAMAASDFFTSVASASAGDRYWLYSGTYTLTGNLYGSTAGTLASNIEIWGCSDQSTPPTEAVGVNRPSLACGSYACRFGGNCHLRNLNFTTSNSDGIYIYNGNNMVFNCKSTQSGNYAGFKSNGSDDSFVNCEATAGSSGQGFYVTAGDSHRFVNCYAHDTRDGFYYTSRTGVCCSFCIADNCTRYGFYPGSSDAVQILNCTIYDCDKGIYGTTGDSPLVMNCTISDCTTKGAEYTTAPGGFWDYNNYYNNGTDRTNVPTGNHDTAVDPEFTAAGSDFSWSSGGNLEDAGRGIDIGVG
jgi:parallel beta-helix repeat protein